MSQPDWARLEALFHAAAKVSGAERQDLLERECGDDLALRSGVERLLLAHDRAGDFIEAPAVELGEALGRPEAPGPADRRIGPYRVIRELGRGGMGTVYLAERADDAFTQRVAIKL